MRVFSRRKLREFWTAHPRARSPLDQWYKAARQAEWKSFDDVRATHGHADRYAKFVIFDIGGNKYRLIVAIHYNTGRVYVRHVLTHADYTRGGWRTE
jgi:mRNA interferase HigB